MSDDLLTSLVSGDPQSAERVKAIVAQLRGRDNLGQLAQLSGDPTLQPFGQHVQQMDQQNEVELGRNAMQNRRDDLTGQQIARQQTQGDATLAETIRYHNMEDQERKDKLAQQKALQTQLADSQGVIDDIGQYKMAPLMSRTPKNVAIMEQVAQQYPQFDDTMYASKKKAQIAFASGPQSNLMRSADVTVQHLDTADELANGLHNGKYPAINSIVNFYKQQTGDPSIAKFNAGKSIISDEVNKFVIGGGGALADREALQKQLADANSTEQLHGVSNTLRTLMGGQLKGLQSQFVNAGLGDENAFLKKLAPRTVGALGFGAAQPGPQSSALPGATGAAGPPGPPPAMGGGPPQSALPGAVGAAGGSSPAQPPGMQTTAQDGSPITPYNRAGLATAMRPDRPAPVTPATEVPGVTIVKKHVNEKGELWALLSDGSEKKLDRTTYQ